MIDLQQLHQWLTAKESERLEFKEAKNNYDLDDLVKYATWPTRGRTHRVWSLSGAAPIERDPSGVAGLGFVLTKPAPMHAPMHEGVSKLFELHQGVDLR